MRCGKIAGEDMESEAAGSNGKSQYHTRLWLLAFFLTTDLLWNESQLFSCPFMLSVEFLFLNFHHFITQTVPDALV